MTEPADAASALAFLLVVVVVELVIAAGIYVWIGISFSKLFQRLSAERWRAWVPLLNYAEVYALGGISRWMVLLLLVPIANLWGLYQFGVAAHRINALFGRGIGFAVLAVFLPPVWATILGFSKATPDPEHGRLDAAPAAAPWPTATGPLSELPAPGAPAPVYDPNGYAGPGWGAPPAPAAPAPAPAAGFPPPRPGSRRFRPPGSPRRGSLRPCRRPRRRPRTRRSGCSRPPPPLRRSNRLPLRRLRRRRLLPRTTPGRGRRRHRPHPRRRPRRRSTR
ncbi:DUF5684 domain-containing protein [Agromyces sp. LHK192]|uniref:DUF5684 domain-containing protein n=1 Tax=Agromyces sp. LHK192 TaxID=2498704 RepID=UPI000FDA583A|nr:DUF5684 domain-containing protein [Agromyces sp. LHK192]